MPEGFLLAASGSPGGGTRSSQPAHGSFRDLTSFETSSRGLSSLQDRSFASPSEALAFPFHNMNRARSAQSLLCRIGLRCDRSEGRSDRLRQTRQ